MQCTQGHGDTEGGRTSSCLGESEGKAGDSTLTGEFEVCFEGCLEGRCVDVREDRPG